MCGCYICRMRVRMLLAAPVNIPSDSHKRGLIASSCRRVLTDGAEDPRLNQGVSSERWSAMMRQLGSSAAPKRQRALPLPPSRVAFSVLDVQRVQGTASVVVVSENNDGRLTQPQQQANGRTLEILPPPVRPVHPQAAPESSSGEASSVVRELQGFGSGAAPGLSSQDMMSLPGGTASLGYWVVEAALRDVAPTGGASPQAASLPAAHVAPMLLEVALPAGVTVRSSVLTLPNAQDTLGPFPFVLTAPQGASSGVVAGSLAAPHYSGLSTAAESAADGFAQAALGGSGAVASLPSEAGSLFLAARAALLRIDVATLAVTGRLVLCDLAEASSIPPDGGDPAAGGIDADGDLTAASLTAGAVHPYAPFSTAVGGAGRTILYIGDSRGHVFLIADATAAFNAAALGKTALASLPYPAVRLLRQVTFTPAAVDIALLSSATVLAGGAAAAAAAAQGRLAVRSLNFYRPPSALADRAAGLQSGGSLSTAWQVDYLIVSAAPTALDASSVGLPYVIPPVAILSSIPLQGLGSPTAACCLGNATDGARQAPLPPASFAAAPPRTVVLDLRATGGASVPRLTTVAVDAAGERALLGTNVGRVVSVPLRALAPGAADAAADGGAAGVAQLTGLVPFANASTVVLPAEAGRANAGAVLCLQVDPAEGALHWSPDGHALPDSATLTSAPGDADSTRIIVATASLPSVLPSPGVGAFVPSQLASVTLSTLHLPFGSSSVRGAVVRIPLPPVPVDLLSALQNSSAVASRARYNLGGGTSSLAGLCRSLHADYSYAAGDRTPSLQAVHVGLSLAAPGGAFGGVRPMVLSVETNTMIVNNESRVLLTPQSPSATPMPSPSMSRSPMRSASPTHSAAAFAAASNGAGASSGPAGSSPAPLASGAVALPSPLPLPFPASISAVTSELLASVLQVPCASLEAVGLSLSRAQLVLEMTIALPAMAPAAANASACVLLTGLANLLADSAPAVAGATAGSANISAALPFLRMAISGGTGGVRNASAASLPLGAGATLGDCLRITGFGAALPPAASSQPASGGVSSGSGSPAAALLGWPFELGPALPTADATLMLAAAAASALSMADMPALSSSSSSHNSSATSMLADARLAGLGLDEGAISARTLRVLVDTGVSMASWCGGASGSSAARRMQASATPGRAGAGAGASAQRIRAAAIVRSWMLTAAAAAQSLADRGGAVVTDASCLSSSGSAAGASSAPVRSMQAAASQSSCAWLQLWRTAATAGMAAAGFTPAAPPPPFPAGIGALALHVLDPAAMPAALAAGLTDMTSVFELADPAATTVGTTATGTTGAADVSPSSSPGTDDGSGSASSGLPLPLLAGAAGGVVVAVAAIMGALFCVARRRVARARAAQAATLQHRLQRARMAQALLMRSAAAASVAAAESGGKHAASAGAHAAAADAAVAGATASSAAVLDALSFGLTTDALLPPAGSAAATRATSDGVRVASYAPGNAAAQRRSARKPGSDGRGAHESAPMAVQARVATMVKGVVSEVLAPPPTPDEDIAYEATASSANSAGGAASADGGASASASPEPVPVVVQQRRAAAKRRRAVAEAASQLSAPFLETVVAGTLETVALTLADPVRLREALITAIAAEELAAEARERRTARRRVLRAAAADAAGGASDGHNGEATEGAESAADSAAAPAGEADDGGAGDDTWGDADMAMEDDDAEYGSAAGADENDGDPQAAVLSALVAAAVENASAAAEAAPAADMRALGLLTQSLRSARPSRAAGAAPQTSSSSSSSAAGAGRPKGVLGQATDAVLPSALRDVLHTETAASDAAAASAGAGSKSAAVRQGNPLRPAGMAAAAAGGKSPAAIAASNRRRGRAGDAEALAGAPDAAPSSAASSSTAAPSYVSPRMLAFHKLLAATESTIRSKGLDALPPPSASGAAAAAPAPTAGGKRGSVTAGQPAVDPSVPVTVTSIRAVFEAKIAAAKARQRVASKAASPPTARSAADDDGEDDGAVAVVAVEEGDAVEGEAVAAPISPHAAKGGPASASSAADVARKATRVHSRGARAEVSTVAYNHARRTGDVSRVASGRKHAGGGNGRGAEKFDVRAGAMQPQRLQIRSVALPRAALAAIVTQTIEGAARAAGKQLLASLDETDAQAAVLMVAAEKAGAGLRGATAGTTVSAAAAGMPASDAALLAKMAAVVSARQNISVVGTVLAMLGCGWSAANAKPGATPLLMTAAQMPSRGLFACVARKPVSAAAAAAAARNGGGMRATTGAAGRRRVVRAGAPVQGGDAGGRRASLTKGGASSGSLDAAFDVSAAIDALLSAPGGGSGNDGDFGDGDAAAKRRNNPLFSANAAAAAASAGHSKQGALAAPIVGQMLLLQHLQRQGVDTTVGAGANASTVQRVLATHEKSQPQPGGAAAQALTAKRLPQGGAIAFALQVREAKDGKASSAGGAGPGSGAEGPSASQLHLTSAYTASAAVRSRALRNGAAQAQAQGKSAAGASGVTPVVAAQAAAHNARRQRIVVASPRVLQQTTGVAADDDPFASNDDDADGDGDASTVVSDVLYGHGGSAAGDAAGGAAGGRRGGMTRTGVLRAAAARASRRSLIPMAGTVAATALVRRR